MLLALSWADGAGFILEEPQEPATAERIWDEIAAYVLANGGTSWNAVESAGNVSGNAALKRQTRDRMIGDGSLIKVAKKGPFSHWHGTIRHAQTAPTGQSVH